MTLHLRRRRCLRTNLRASKSAHSINSHVCLNAARPSSYLIPSSSARSRSASTSTTSAFTFAWKSLRDEMRWCHQPCVFITSRSNNGMTGILLILGVSDAKIAGRLMVSDVSISTLTQWRYVCQLGRRHIKILYVALRHLEGFRKHRWSELTMVSLMHSATE